MPTDRPWDGTIVRYPDPAIEVLDDRFAPFKIPNSVVERLWTGARWTEGPVYFGDGRFLLFSDIPNNRIMKWDETTGETSVFRQPSHNSNGHTRDHQGRLVSCEHFSRRVTRTEHDGAITVLLDQFDRQSLFTRAGVALDSQLPRKNDLPVDVVAGPAGDAFGHPCGHSQYERVVQQAERLQRRRGDVPGGSCG